MGGVGSGNYYRFDKKTTADDCHSVDVRHLHRHGLLKLGGWFSLRWSRAGRESGSIRGVVDSPRPPRSMTLLYRHRSRLGAEWEEGAARVGSVQPRGTAPLVVEAGAQIMVAGSAVYKGDPVTEMRKIVAAGRRAARR